jgi:hypothetical protein
VNHRRFLLLLGATFFEGIVGGLLSDQVLSSQSVQAQKPNVANAEEFLLLNSVGKARAGLGLDANGEVGLVPTSKDGNRSLTLSPDDRAAIKIGGAGGGCSVGSAVSSTVRERRGR